MAGSWFDRLIHSVAERGRAWVKLPVGLPPLDQVRELARNLVSERGEASGAALARVLLDRYLALSDSDRAAFLVHLAQDFAPDPIALAAAAQRYLDKPTPRRAAELAETAEAPRQELLRRINMAAGGTAALVAMRAAVTRQSAGSPDLDPLESDLRHLLASWFNRGFLELKRIDWHTPAVVLEKLIAYEAVHEIHGWTDLRRRLAPDRRCFAYFHPSLPDEPLIFVEVALVNGLAGAITPLLAPEERGQTRPPDTAIFYSISNCQKGLRGISFGNFLIKQVVEDLRQEVPSLMRFATLSPVPGFRVWLDEVLAGGTRHLLRADERAAIKLLAGKGAKGAFRRLLNQPGWQDDPAVAAALQPPLTRLCAVFLTANVDGKGPIDPVARFHLGNGARLERINWLANTSARGIRESHGLMVNYLYDRERIEANHEAFVRQGHVAHSTEVADLMREETRTSRVVGGLIGRAAGRRG
jgi:malonyl-CoA decarboxylase